MIKLFSSAFIFFLAVGGFAQEGSPTPERIKLVKAGESAPTLLKKSPEVAKPALTPEQELVSCETQLAALIKKEEIIRSNPDELKLAEANGWFIDAAITKAVLEKRIEALKIQLKK